jgi:hypothetical protein
MVWRVLIRGKAAAISLGNGQPLVEQQKFGRESKLSRP